MVLGADVARDVRTACTGLQALFDSISTPPILPLVHPCLLGGEGLRNFLFAGMGSDDVLRIRHNMMCTPGASRNKAQNQQDLFLTGATAG